MALPTTLIGPDTDFSGVAVGPALLQQYIPKRADIRLTSIGSRLFAARKTAEPEQVDGRFGDTGHTWEPVAVPGRIARAVHEYLTFTGLAYAAFDFAEDKEGVWWFLEGNQGGQFGFVELETGQPIAEAVALWLSQRRPDGRAPRRAEMSRALRRLTASLRRFLKDWKKTSSASWLAASSHSSAGVVQRSE